jgi:Flp pilus assembly protein protease CpaA
LRRNSAALIAAALIVLAVWLRLWHLGWMPGIDGDEGWWGVQALRWLHDLLHVLEAR